ncbi:MAG: winged helix-turn-helix transcriptional regulator [Fusobacteriaceae bacterium]
MNRKEYPQVPPKVEYSITEKGSELIQILTLMHEWGSKN